MQITHGLRPVIRTFTIGCPQASHRFSVRWTGQVQPPTTGRYTFYTTTDDGARVTINGQRIIVNSFFPDGKPNFVSLDPLTGPQRGVPGDAFVTGKAPLTPQNSAAVFTRA